MRSQELGVGDSDDKYERGSTLSVPCGLHIFRYVSFQGGGAPALARLIPPGEGVTLLDMPGRERGLLQRPGDCIALRADRASEVVVGLRRGSVNGSLEASFRLEPIVLVDAAPAAATPVRAGKSGLSFVAHLANRGDVAFAQNVWAGGPDAPAAVEGLEIVGESDGGPLEMQVLVGSRPPRWSQWVGAGQYAGTRGHGLPLTGLRLRVSPEAVGVEIAAEALFLGSLVASQRGRQVEFVSGSGVDPLVGMKVAVESVQANRPSRLGAEDAEAQARDKEPRVRVFRASSGR
jgi:hypothetical protein